MGLSPGSEVLPAVLDSPLGAVGLAGVIDLVGWLGIECDQVDIGPLVDVFWHESVGHGVGHRFEVDTCLKETGRLVIPPVGALSFILVVGIAVDGGMVVQRSPEV